MCKTCVCTPNFIVHRSLNSCVCLHFITWTDVIFVSRRLQFTRAALHKAHKILIYLSESWRIFSVGENYDISIFSIDIIIYRLVINILFAGIVYPHFDWIKYWTNNEMDKADSEMDKRRVKSGETTSGSIKFIHLKTIKYRLKQNRTANEKHVSMIASSG